MHVICQLLKKSKLIDDEDLLEAEKIQKATGGNLLDILAGTGKISRLQVLQTFHERLGIPFLEHISEEMINPEALALLTPQQCREMEVIPVDVKESGALSIAISDTADLGCVDNVRFVTGLRVEPVIVPREKLSAVLKRLLPEMLDIESKIRTLEETDCEVVESAGQPKKEVDDISDAELYLQAPVIALVSLILKQAILARASDIHLEPKEGYTRLRYRIDGALVEKERLPGRYSNAVTARIKVLSRLDISEKRRPQDGSFTVKYEKRRVDFRVSTIPTSHGEKVVMRILDKSAFRMSLDGLGFPERVSAGINDIKNVHEGIFLVTGPTGSGKSTTLYSLIASMDSPATNIVTLEDPIEYQMETITQSQINPKAGFTFASGLRSILRQDPDVILVGEVRDLETARIAVQASLTGHLVFATLHTNSAIETVIRLQDMGLEPFLISAALKAALAQRLARRLCKECREPYTPSLSLIEKFSEAGVEVPVETQFYRPAGCKACDGVGYRGRLGLYELFRMTEEAQRMVVRGAELREIQQAAVRDGYRTLRQSGLDNVVAGVTSVEEVYRIT
jgi:type IV pilus assembly protein PilB